MDIQVGNLSRIVAFCDPASGKKLALKRVRARSAIVVIGKDLLNRIFVLHAWASRCSTSILTETILKVNQEWRPKVFGIEANAMQSLFGDMVNREAKYRGSRLPFLPVNQPSHVDKDWRIRSVLQPTIAEGRLLIQPSQYELKAELTNFPMSTTKDLIDALASAVALMPMGSIGREREGEAEALAQYLRSTGAPPEYIRQRVDDVRRAEGAEKAEREMTMEFGPMGRTR
jgi:predicted phage terminase large subunit-like protein